jgi:hypothetical protein
LTDTAHGLGKAIQAKYPAQWDAIHAMASDLSHEDGRHDSIDAPQLAEAAQHVLSGTTRAQEAAAARDRLRQRGLHQDTAATPAVAAPAATPAPAPPASVDRALRRIKDNAPEDVADKETIQREIAAGKRNPDGSKLAPGSGDKRVDGAMLDALMERVRGNDFATNLKAHDHLKAMLDKGYRPTYNGRTMGFATMREAIHQINLHINPSAREYEARYGATPSTKAALPDRPFYPINGTDDGPWGYERVRQVVARATTAAHTLPRLT